MNDLDQFLESYEHATNTHNYGAVAPFVAESAVYWFNDGCFEGHDAIREAFESTWNTVRNEAYSISNVRWIARSETIAACVYDFAWLGEIDGTHRSGTGRGTNILTKMDNGWRIVHEHLSK